jgi:hypothetical protein
MKLTTRSILVVVVSLALIASASGAAVAANSEYNYSADAAHNPYIEADTTIENYDMGWDGLKYEDDSGELADLPAELNESVDNPYEFVPTDVNFTDRDEFPHDKDEVSALTASEWSGTATASDVTTAPNVDAVEIDLAGSDEMSFSNFSITSDEQKRYLTMFVDVSELNSGAVVEIRAVDDDGDYYAATINPSADPSAEDVVANATGEGYVFQRQVGAMTLQTAGDGTFDNIQKVEVNETGGSAATIQISALNLDKTSPYQLGTKLEDTDDDDELEDVEIEEVTSAGTIAIESLDTMGATFDSATIKGLTVPAKFTAEQLPDDDADVAYESADNYPNFDTMVTGEWRISLPDAYDLSFANAELKDVQALPSQRYVSMRYAEGVGDTDFSDIDSWAAVEDSYDSQDADVTLDQTIQPGTEIALQFEYLATSDEVDSLQAAGAAGPVDDGDQGFFDWLFGVPGMVMAGLGLVVQRFRGAWPFSG